jgi:hypothetical protein
MEVKATPAERDGWFELPGCEPDGKVAVWFYDPDRQEGPG